MFDIIRRLRKALRFTYQFLYSVMIIDSALVLFGRSMADYKWLLVMFAVLLYSYIVREFCPNGAVCLFVHIVPGVFCWFVVTPIFERILLIGFVVGYFFDAFGYIRCHYFLKRAFDIPWGSFVLGLTCVILGWYMKVPMLIRMGLIVPLITISIFLVSLYLEGLESYAYAARKVSGAPIGQILSVNSLVVMCILSIIYVVLFISDLLNVVEIFNGLGMAILAILKILIILLVLILSFVMSFFGIGSLNTSRRLKDIQYVAEETNIFDKIVQFLLYVIVISAVGFLIYSLFRWIIRLLLEKGKKNNEESESIKKKKKPVIKKERYRNPDALSGNNPVMKARKLYKKSVKNYRFYFKPDSYDTTGDIKVALEKPQKDIDADELTKLYDGVRYGGIIPDRDYLAKMKRAAKSRDA